MKTPAVLLLVTAGFALFAAAQSTKEIKKAPISPTAVNSGPEMFKNYCAACHGVDGKGGGPAAAALKIPPADLTALAKKNSGKFPTARVERVIGGDDAIAAHGSSEMPLWRPLFDSLSPSNESMAKLRIANLTKYIESLQK